MRASARVQARKAVRQPRGSSAPPAERGQGVFSADVAVVSAALEGGADVDEPLVSQ